MKIAHGKSQHGEDRILKDIFTRIGSGTKTFVDIGARYEGSNTAQFADLGWSGIWMEADSKAVECLMAEAKGRPVSIVADVIWSGNVLEHVGSVADLLSIDIDGQDYWVLKRLLESGWTPRVIVVECSKKASVGYVVPEWSEKPVAVRKSVGCAFDVMEAMVTRHGYVLEETENVNQIYVRTDCNGHDNRQD